MMHAKTISRYSKFSQGKLKAKAQKVFNAWVRNRDQDEYGYFVCISCGKRKRIIWNREGGSNFHAGHFYPAGSCEALRFDPDNVHGQCVKCNYYGHSVGADYARNLELKIGKERVEKLHQKAAIAKRMLKKFDRFDLIDIIEKYK